MAVRTLQALFRLSTLGFLVGGVALVAGQALGVALGDAAWVAHVENIAGRPTFVAAGVAGLLAFVLSYTTPKKDSGAPTSDAPGPRHTTSAPQPE